MATVTNTNAIRYRYLGQEECAETLKTETLREKILKQLVKKQLSTNTSLENEHKQQREFMKAASEESITAHTRGLATYQDYRGLEESLAVRQTLKSSGLSDEEIKLLLDEEDKNLTLEAPHARQERLKYIEDKLCKRQQQLEASASQNEQFHGAVVLNRHQYEEECSVVSATPEAEKLTDCLVRLQPHHDAAVPSDHPINYIKDIAQELFPSCDEAREEQKKDNPRKRRNKGDTHITLKKLEEEETNIVYLTKKPKTLWDLKKIPKVISDDHENAKNHQKSNVLLKITSKSDKAKEVKVDPTKPFVLTLNKGDLIPLHAIESNRMSVSELKKLEMFKYYTTGTPSPTLYIKNLSNKLTPTELAALMGNFESCESPKIQYRILGGRMKGQAFVTFPSADVASQALGVCNGFIMHGKPLVIEFGRKQKG